MKKIYVKPENAQFKTESKCPILSGSNYLDNGTDEDAGAKAESTDKWDDLWCEDQSNKIGNEQGVLILYQHAFSMKDSPEHLVPRLLL